MTIGSVPVAKPGLGYSMSALATEYGIDRRTASRLLENCSPCGSSRGSPVYRIKDASMPIVKYLIGAEITHDYSNDFDPNSLPPKERKDWYDSELKRVQHAKVTGELIPADIIANADAAKNKKIALALDTLGDVLERDVGLNSEQVNAVNRIIDGIRNDLYRSLTENE